LLFVWNDFLCGSCEAELSSVCGVLVPLYRPQPSPNPAPRSAHWCRTSDSLVATAPHKRIHILINMPYPEYEILIASRIIGRSLDMFHSAAALLRSLRVSFAIDIFTLTKAF